VPQLDHDNRDECARAGGRRFTVVPRPEEREYSVQCLELPQAISRGETKKEALAGIKEAIELVLEHLKDREKGRSHVRHDDLRLCL